MAINPGDLNTVSSDQLPSAAFSLTDYITHGIGPDLKKGTIQELADFLSLYLGAIGGVGFRAVTVTDGGTLPATTQEEFILVGAGTYYNVGGGATIVCTEELNALVSNGTFWFVGVEIPINVELAGITQLIRSGFTNTTPSEDAVFTGLADTLTSANNYANSLITVQEIRIPVNDANYNVAGVSNQLISFTAITADRSVFFPPATQANQRIRIADESFTCGGSRRILVIPNGSDTISGGINSVINFPGGSALFESNGAGKWVTLSTTAIQLSAGVNTLPTYTDNANGTVTIGNGGVYTLFANTDGSGRPKSYSITGGTFTMVDGSLNYIIAKYDSTTATTSLITSTSESDANSLSSIKVFSIFRQGTVLFPRDNDKLGLALSNKLQRNAEQTNNIRVTSGTLLLSESATRIVNVSAGTAWIGGNEIPLSAVASSTANTMFFVTQTSPGVWNTTTFAPSGQYSNTQYNDPTTGLQTLSNGRYGVIFVFRSLGQGNKLAYVLGQGDYNLGQAQTATRPNNLPLVITSQMIPVGRIIIQKNASTATQIDKITDESYAFSGVTDHEVLSNLLGGDANGHYHLTQAEKDKVNISQITITTSVSITTATTDAGGLTQNGRHVIIDNGVNAINITVNGVGTGPVSYQKEGTGAITFVQGSGRTLRQVDGTAVLNGAVGSTATISSFGTIDSLRISNA